VCLLFALEASRQIWPPLDGDGAILFPPAVEISLGRELKSPVWVWPLDESVDGPEGRRLVYHGFLYQMAVGEISAVFGGGPIACLWVLHGLNWLAAAICSFAILGWIPAGSPFRPAISFMLPIQNLVILEAWIGRPEPIAALSLGVALFICRYFRPFKAFIACWGIVPIVFFTSPAIGVLSGLFLVARFTFLPKNERLQVVLMSGVAVLLATFAVIMIYPYPIVDWLKGVQKTGNIALSVQPYQGLLSAWVKRPELPFLLIVFFVPLSLALFRAHQLVQKNGKRDQVIFWACLAACLFILFRISLVKAEAVYNATVFLPILWALAWGTGRELFRSTLLFASGIPLLAAFAWKSAILMERSRTQPIAFTALQKAIEEKTEEGLAVAPAFYLACPDPWRVRFAEASEPKAQEEKWLITKQANTGRSTPLDLPGYLLETDRFGPPLRFFGFAISNSPKGWEYAVYQKEP